MPHAICWPPPERLVRFGRVDAVQPHKPDNPYQAWIDTYADEAFAAGVKK